MIRLLSYILILVVSCHLSFSQEFSVATFNAEFLNKSRVHIKFGKQFDITRESKKEQKYWAKEENRAEKLQEASANVAQFLKSLNADVITLTEVGSKDDIKVLITELEKIDVSYEYWEVCDCRDSFTMQHVAVLSKFRFPIVHPELET